MTQRELSFRMHITGETKEQAIKYFEQYIIPAGTFCDMHISSGCPECPNRWVCKKSTVK